MFAILMKYKRIKNILYKKVKGDNSVSIHVGIYVD